MKGKAVVTTGIEKEVAKALRGQSFAVQFLTKVVGKDLGAENPLDRPAEYYVQRPDYIVQAKDGLFGVEFRLTGTTINGRTPAQFHRALETMHALVKTTITNALKEAGSGNKIQMFCVIMMDGAIETKPGSREYSNVIESDAEWVSAQ